MTPAAERAIVRITKAMPYRGRCGICGGPDARHREWDSWRAGYSRAGEPVKRIARWYEAPSVALVRDIVRLTPQQYGALLRRRSARAESPASPGRTS